MKPMAHLVAVVAGLVLLLTITPSWGQPPNPTASDANENTAGGTGALINVDETASGGFDNTAFGFQALLNNTTGDFNTASGAFALFGNGTGHHNTASGAGALSGNTIGSFNTATGNGALNRNTTGSGNTANGVNALLFNSTGNKNTAVGFDALLNNGPGIKNTAVGTVALSQSTGNKNIAIGFNAGAQLTSGNNNIYIGSPGVSSESLTMRLGSVQTSTFIAGIATAAVSGAAVEIDTTTGQLGIATSSAHYKRDIAPMGSRSQGVLQLRPVTFAYKDDAQGMVHYGLIAEEVAAVYPELVTHTPTGEVQGVRYQELIPMLLNELQRQRQELAELRALLGQGHETASLSWERGLLQ